MVKRLQEEVKNKDIEEAHYNADQVLCDLLEELGYKEVVDTYNKVDKYYS